MTLFVSDQSTLIIRMRIVETKNCKIFFYGCFLVIYMNSFHLSELDVNLQPLLKSSTYFLIKARSLLK